MQDPNLRALLVGTPDIVIFDKPMSKDARKLLIDIIKWSSVHSHACFKVPNPQLACIRAFAAEYNVIKFEEACHRFNLKTYGTLIGKHFKPNKVENLMNVMLLRNLDDRSWVQNNNIESNVNRIGALSNDRTIEVYNWLTTYYILTDFTGSDLNKIVDMGGDEYNLQRIKDEANRITEHEKKTIPYLHAIMKDVVAREAAVRSKERVVGSHYEERLQKVFSYGGPKIQHANPDKAAEWRREREWLDTLIDLDKK